MHSFRGGFLERFSVPLSSVWLLTDIAEAKGRQALSIRQAPQLLAGLRDTALVQSVESSNRIEGVTVAPNRLVPLVLENAAPRDRSEEEIRGYRLALDLLHASADDRPVTPDLFRRLHGLCQDGAGDAGQCARELRLSCASAPSPRPRPQKRSRSSASPTATS